MTTRIGSTMTTRIGSNKKKGIIETDAEENYETLMKGDFEKFIKDLPSYRFPWQMESYKEYLLILLKQKTFTEHKEKFV